MGFGMSDNMSVDVAAAEWWINTLQYDTNSADAKRRDLDNLVKMKNLMEHLANSIRAAVESWEDKSNVPYSIDTTFGGADEILVNALEAADIKGAKFKVGVLMEVTKKYIRVSTTEIIFGEAEV